MSEETKKIISTIKQGKLPPLSSSSNKSSTTGTQASQRGTSNTVFALQTLKEDTSAIIKKRRD